MDQPTPAIPSPERAASRFFTVRFAAWLWRGLTRPLCWLRRHFIKIALWSTTLITLAWQYENWQGPHALAEQRRLWVAEYGDMKWDDFAPPRVPDEENFFAAPVFETFVFPPRTAPKDPHSLPAFNAAKAMPHARFLNMAPPSLAMCPGTIPEQPATAGLKTLDVAAWATAQKATGAAPPAGLSNAAWLHASMPQDPTVSGLIQALSRPKAALLPQAIDRWAVGKALHDPSAIPIGSWSGCLSLVNNLSLRARAAARTGDAALARDLALVMAKINEGFSNDGSMIGPLVGLATESALFEALGEGLAAKCWQDADLLQLARSLEKMDEEKSVFTGLKLACFGTLLWAQENSVPMYKFNFGASVKYLRYFKYGPAGWDQANLANHLRLARAILIPDGPGDDLLALSKKLITAQQAMREEFKTTPSPRSIVAWIAMPAMSNIPQRALEYQTRRRQMLMSIAAERFALAHGKYPVTALEMVPDFLPEIPRDPNAPGTPMRYETAHEGERYRLVSAGPDGILALPATP